MNYRRAHHGLAGTLLFLVLVPCAVQATALRDVKENELTEQTHVVYGSFQVFENGKVKKLWGDLLLMILPPESNESLGYRVDKDGIFFWALNPGDYTLVGYHTSAGGARDVYLGWEFHVPETGTDSYLGAIELREDEIGLRDDFAQTSAVYDATFPSRKGTSVRRPITIPPPVGHFTSIAGPCHASWALKCGDRFLGITPTSPAVKKSGFPRVDTLTPKFSWMPSARDDVRYDLIVYEAASYNSIHMRGRVAIYEEGLSAPNWQPSTPLKAGTRYLWSVRLRDGDTVSWWTTQSHFGFYVVMLTTAWGQWFQFQTPEQ